MAIEMRSQRGQIGRSWVAREFGRRMEMLLGSRGKAIGKRLARAGTVQWVDVRPGSVTASMDDPQFGIVEPRLDLHVFTGGDRDLVERMIAQDPSFVLTLLDGTYGADRESELLRHDLGLLPSSHTDITWDCACPAGMSVCPHVYALVYVLMEHLDDAPGDLLLMRGIDLEDLRGPEGDGDAVPGDSGGAEPAPSSGSDSAAGAEDGAERATEAASIDPQADEEPAGQAQAQDQDQRKRFNPALVDASVLSEMVGDQVQGVFARFYATGTTAADERATPDPDPDPDPDPTLAS